ncbi:glycosyltransferase family A protein [Weissella soli]|uniref:glycosyltransferase family A protein n=1 Tax=Weissella soli TaxID=155866 RepID=UPI001F1E7525|nr:glycosyltransferase family 2 protein [Weissella soli]GJM47739.1 family 2 glycosyl transferase [Weissella soli]
MQSKNSPIVSIIIPIYNVEKYLDEALNSLLSNRIIDEDVEVLLINDGSTDSSEKIVQSFVDTHEGRISLYTKVNGGLSDARNFGLHRAQGRWVYFFDSDDIVDYNFLEDLKNEIYKNEKYVDLIAVPTNKFYGEVPESKHSSKHKLSDQIVSPSVYIEKILTREREIATWSYISKKDLYLDNSLLFPVGELFEDQLITVMLANYSAAILLLGWQHPTHQYRQRAASITADITISKAKKQFEAEKRKDQFLLKKYPNIQYAIFADFVAVYFAYFIRLIKDGNIGRAKQIRSEFLGLNISIIQALSDKKRTVKTIIKFCILYMPIHFSGMIKYIE